MVDVQSPANWTRLRRDVGLTWKDGGVVSMSTKDTDVQIAPKSDEMRSGLRNLLHELEAGVKTPFDWAAPSQFALLSHLKSQRLLVPFDPSQSATAASNVHARLTVAALASWRTVPDYVGDELRNDTVSADFLFGLAVEYYFVTALALRSIAGAANHGPIGFRKLVRKMIVEEYGHDMIMRAGLTGFGVSSAEIQLLTPLAYTRALLSRLANAARRDPHVFSALIFLFEYSAAGADEVFESSLQLHGAPASFVNAVREHNKINAEGRHSDASAELFCALPDPELSAEDSLANELWLAIRLFANQSRGLLRRYGGRLLQATDQVASDAPSRVEVASEAASVLLGQIYSWSVRALSKQPAFSSNALLTRIVLNETAYPDARYSRVRPGAPVAIYAISDFIDDLTDLSVGQFLSTLGAIARHLTTRVEVGTPPLRELETIAKALADSQDQAPLDPQDDRYFSELVQELDAEIDAAEILGAMPVLSRHV